MSRRATVHHLELVELNTMNEAQWDELVAGEREPFGGLAEDLVWSRKERHVALCEPDGRLVAAAGAVLAEVAVGSLASFQVVGLGGVIVTRSHRGQGLMRVIFEALLGVAAEMGPDRAMLFCLPSLIALYEHFGCMEIPETVWAEQPEGRLEVPLCAMWRPLREGVPAWPAGRVEVLGLPF
jgi:predicted GNAT family N-acyltransferase